MVENPGRAAVSAPAKGKRCPQAQDSVARALAAASDCGGRVEVYQARTERGQVFANKDGSFTSVQAARTQRVRTSDGSWVTPDATLRRGSDGRWAPKAAALGMSFSGGGDAPLAAVRRGRGEVTLRWAGADGGVRRLPEPVAAGNTLTYREVLVGVDLVVSAEVEGFGETLVVKTPQAARSPELAEVRFAAEAKGVRLREGEHESLLGVADSGETLFASGTPMMWDSSTAQPAGEPLGGSSSGGASRAGAAGGGGPVASSPAGPGEGAAVAAMPLEVTDAAVTVRPDRGLLERGSTSFPLYIDPALLRMSWTMINNRYPGTSYWAYDRYDCPVPHRGIECAKVGYTDEATTMVYRSLFQFSSSEYVGKHVLDAKLSMDLVHSWVCTDSRTDVHVINAPLGSGTSWNTNAGAWLGLAASTSNSSCNRARRRTEWGLTGTAQAAAAQWWPSMTLGLKAANESNHNGWKKFDAGTAFLTVTYNSYPNAPDSLSVEGAGCASGAGRPWIRTLTPTLRARVSDPDGYDRALTGTFWWWPLGGSPNGSDAVSQGALASGTSAQAGVPAGRLVDGTTYVVRAQAYDGIDVGQYSPTCEFSVDATPPPTPGGVTSSEYPADGQLHGGAGVAGQFAFAPPTSGVTDVAGYAYTLDNGVQPAQAAQVAADATGHGASVLITPPTDGPKTLRVWARDVAGNYSKQPVSYAFGVRAGAGPDAVWLFDEGEGSRVSDASGHGNPLTVDEPAWTPGRGRIGSALLMSGRGGAASDGPVTTVEPGGDPKLKATTVRTDANLTVSAWVRLDSTGGGIKTVVCQDGARTSAFSLEYSGVDDRWRFTMAGSDIDAPTVYAVISDVAPTVGRWTHLLGSYDTASRALKLYVDGAAQAATATVTGTFNATGPVAVGRRRAAGASGGAFTGAIEDVRIYARVVGPGETEFTNPLKPLKPVITFPDGAEGKIGQAMRVTLDTGGDPMATSVKYSIGAQTLALGATLPAAGGRVTVTVTPRLVGEQHVFAAAVGGAGRQSETVAGIINALDAPAVSGTVLDPNGAPVSSAVVRLMPGNTVVTTSSDGTYVFGGLSKAAYTVSAAVPTQACSLYAVTEVSVDTATYVDLRLGPQSDLFGYTCSTQSQPFISAGTVVHAGAMYGGSVSVALPFPVKFYGETATTAYVMTEGFISFADEYAWWGSDHIPNGAKPNGIVVPFGHDMYQDDLSSIRTASGGSAPNRQFVIEWRDVVLSGIDGRQRVTFEVVFDESGDLTFNYFGLSTIEQQGLAASVGIESPGGGHGIQYSFEQPALRSGVAVTFKYPPQPRPIPKAAISGTVIDDGKPVAGARVVLQPQWLFTTTGTNGEFMFAELEGASGYTVSTDVGCKGASIPLRLDEAQVIKLALTTSYGDYGYWCEVENRTFVPANDAILPIAVDRDEASITLPFTMPFFGRLHRTLTVNSGGWAYFGDDIGEVSGGVDDDPGEVSIGCASCWSTITPYGWDGSGPYVDDKTSVRIAMVGTAPSRQVIVEWRDVALDVEGELRVTFEAILVEDGTVIFNYQDLDTDAERGGNVTVGIDNGHDQGKEYTDGLPILANGRAIVFHPPVS